MLVDDIAGRVDVGGIGEAVDEQVLRIEDFQLHMAVHNVELDKAAPVQKLLVTVESRRGSRVRLATQRQYSF